VLKEQSFREVFGMLPKKILKKSNFAKGETPKHIKGE